ncbi:MAG: hypothetical protein WCR80_06740, partial [Bacilli bacterium]
QQFAPGVSKLLVSTTTFGARVFVTTFTGETFVLALTALVGAFVVFFVSVFLITFVSDFLGAMYIFIK